MDMKGEHRIPASRQAVWDALNDPEVLKASIPGCESVEKISDTEFTAKVKMSVGPVKTRFSGQVTLSDIDPPNGYTITGKGSGGAAGFGEGNAKVTLTEEGGETVLRYTAHASVGGKLAQIGQRLIDATAKKMTNEFFTGFVDHLVETGIAVPAPEAVAVPEAAAGLSKTAQWAMIGAVAAAVVLALIWYVSG